MIVIEFLRSEIFSKVSLASSVIKKNNSLPVLDYIKFSVDSGGVFLSATDLAIEVQVRVNTVSVDGGIGSFILDANVLKETLSKLDEQLVSFSISDNKCDIIYNAGKGNIAIPLGDVNDFPIFNVGGDLDNSIEIEEGWLKKHLTIAKQFVSNDELRPTLMGVLFETSSKGLTIVATDAHKLVVLKKDGEYEDSSVIVPLDMVSFLAKNLKDTSHIVKYDYGLHSGVFSISDMVVRFRTVEGKYPSYKSVIPPNGEELKFHRQDMLSSLNALSAVVNNTTTKGISLQIELLEIILTAVNIDFNRSGRDSVPCESKSKGVTIGFNKDFLQTAISVLGEVVTMLYIDSSRACVFKSDNILCLVMPIMLK